MEESLPKNPSAGGLRPNDAHPYVPQPLDTSSIQLGEDLIRLADLLAENSHDVWAQERLTQGWKWGSVYDDQSRQDPALVRYGELPESEKVLRCKTALETVKMAFSLGLAKQETESRRANDTTLLGLAPVEKARRIALELKRPALTSAQLRRIWEERMPIVWLRGVEVYRRAVDAALKLGESFLAFDIAEEGLIAFRNDLRLVQLQALALARTGATRRANEMLEQLRLSGHHDEETLGILARTHKDLWLLSSEPGEKELHLKLSFEFYSEAYRRNRGYYSGINAAAMALLFGQTEEARRIAREVSDLCLRTKATLPCDSDEQYWIEATLAESALVEDDLKRAECHYQMAAESHKQNWAVLNRTRKQAQLLLECLGHDRRTLDPCFKLPSVVVCAGHMFDHPNRSRPRFPLSIAPEIQRQMRQRLDAMQGQIGFCSLACGTDMIFAEAMFERGGEVNIVLPFNQEDFRKSSVDFVASPEIEARFQRLIENAASITVLNESGLATDEAAFEYCNHVLIGLALLKGRFLGLNVRPLAVWDGKPADGRGGTEDFVGYWQDRGKEVEVIGVSTSAKQDPPLPVASTVNKGQPLGQTEFFIRSADEVSPQEIKAMLFADIKGYTKLSEKHVPPFVHHFMASVARLMDARKVPPIVRNSWGDAIYCVFDRVADAGSFALELRDLIRNTDWTQKGLPADLNIRIGLHAGPAYPCFDPVTRKLTYLGSHVNRTARIEPVAEEGQIYASQAFAALSAAEGVKEYTCDYVGQKQLAKQFGAIPVFLINRPG